MKNKIRFVEWHKKNLNTITVIALLLLFLGLLNYYLFNYIALILTYIPLWIITFGFNFMVYHFNKLED